MEEEKIDQELPAPPRFRNTFFKIATLTLLFLVLFFTIGFVGLETSSSSEFCSSCHEMKPEYYTWKASSHGEVDCVNCHIEPGVENLAKAKGNGLVELYKKQTQTYTAPIRMPKDIPDKSCERCHNVYKRDVTPSGDLIIPHDKHKNEGIECIQCHSGVAHAKIADRKMTFKTDYAKWDESVGKSAMEDVSWTKPDMDTCMSCHESREITLECAACHTSGMYPESHKKADFKTSNHGTLAKKDLSTCNNCHKYMSKDEIKGFEEAPAHTQYLNKGSTANSKIKPQDYAKTNTYCRDCHSKKPESHKRGFVSKHGDYAKSNETRCLACHDYQKTGTHRITNTTCNSCHPSSHGNDFRITHPVDVPVGQKLNNTCYQCHSKRTCTACHRN
ncbi:NapC/NirT family cytochrome c [Neobacillus sp. SCS-31]|uniref:NapC/NirT family cytochrome c n=1 Tax=Neobacillus oceani TaxID=3115292 RepID=UPI003906BE90